ncbi:scavenger receptor class B member 1 [Diabrotica virgifera virgifera]|uniref:Scavenger receptor class B member 1 n=1 Tax=Diabrotica virgifera virgifera TaxID=50390 RepID=A0A6P7FDW4_DIAVI|nr:scavenger receptor class B member 1 [Diabrotica virgifera virgifera]XP_028131555.1 scavenger receptor class B member 1 [Diabrotica virgifera virgifera]XP_028131564.1 scavenger receptor class B member 1 [Diabrotica virgifera virgifera]XP_028131574.1 scavenger receptor class B member 1 [Diabrotica virgifera virgifera]
MGLYKQYFRLTRYAKNQFIGISNSQKKSGQDDVPLQMLVSQHFSHSRLAVILVGLFTLAIGIILSSIPWLDYIILKNLRLSDGSLSYQYWQKPGVIRLTKVYIFNVTNPDTFLTQGEKPRLQEVGPFVYREEMEKVNIQFHDNGTVSFQHKKILQFVPELSVNKNQKITVPNIPLLTLSTMSNNLGYFVQKGISVMLSIGSYKPFISITADELVFGYDDKLVSLAHQFYPKYKRPAEKMGLLINRNGTLPEVHNIYTGSTGMHEFGIIDKLNGKDSLTYWEDAPCNDLRSSEGSFFPPRHYTNEDLVYLYDKDICRTLPLKYRKAVSKHGIAAGLYTPPENIFESVEKNSDNKCYCPGNEFCPPKGLQNISPCQFDSPVYISFPHFLDADSSLSEPFEGLTPNRDKHESYFKIQPKLGVPLEGQIRVQLNLKVDQAPYVTLVKDFPSIIFPIMWLEEGIEDLTPSIRRWVYLATTFADVACPLMTYGFIFTGTCIILGVFVNAYKSLVFTKETIEIGMKKLQRRGSAYLYSSSNRFINRRDTYTLLKVNEDGDEEVIGM